MPDVATEPPTAEDLNRLGHEAYETGSIDNARAYYEAALQLDQLLPKSWANLGVTLSTIGLRYAALVCFRRAVQIDPDNISHYSNLGNGLFLMGEFEQAKAVFVEGIKRSNGRPIEPRSIAGLLGNAALNAIALEEFDAAQNYQTIAVLSAREDNPDTASRLMFDLAHAQLAAGNFEQGWISFEARATGLDKLPAQSLPQPDWKGENLTGKSLLVFHEQGFGDTLQFCRLLGEKPIADIEVIFAVPKQLVRLMRCSFPDRFISVIDQDGPLPITDYKIGLMGMPRYLINSMDDISGAEYLIAPTVHFPLARADFAIGICWAGGHNGTPTDNARSMEIDQFLRLAEIPGVSLHSLQAGGREQDIYARGATTLVEDLAYRMTDFAETAAIIEKLDLVVTVDTAVAHLAGGMGKLVILLSRYVGCWRWFGRKNTESAWYDSMLIVHQHSPGDWPEAMDRVIEATRAMKAASDRGKGIV